MAGPEVPVTAQSYQVTGAARETALAPRLGPVLPLGMCARVVAGPLARSGFVLPPPWQSFPLGVDLMLRWEAGSPASLHLTGASWGPVRVRRVLVNVDTKQISTFRKRNAPQ